MNSDPNYTHSELVSGSIPQSHLARQVLDPVLNDGDTPPWRWSPMPDGFGASGTLSGVPREKIDRLLRAAESKNTRSVIAAILDLYDGLDGDLELRVGAIEQGDRMYWTFTGDRRPAA